MVATYSHDESRQRNQLKIDTHCSTIVMGHVHPWTGYGWSGKDVDKHEQSLSHCLPRLIDPLNEDVRQN